MSAIELNDKRQIVIDLSWLLGALNDEQKRNLVDSLACEDCIIADVSAQLLTGWTELGSSGGRACGADAEPWTPLDKARRELASRAGEVALKEIEDLKRALIWSKAMQEHYTKGYFALYHAWSDRGLGRCPDIGPIPSINSSEFEVVRKATA